VTPERVTVEYVSGVTVPPPGDTFRVWPPCATRNARAVSLFHETLTRSIPGGCTGRKSPKLRPPGSSRHSCGWTRLARVALASWALNKEHADRGAAVILDIGDAHADSDSPAPNRGNTSDRADRFTMSTVLPTISNGRWVIRPLPHSCRSGSPTRRCGAPAP
jgi:hypothetical protein